MLSRDMPQCPKISPLSHTSDVVPRYVIPRWHTHYQTIANKNIINISISIITPNTNYTTTTTTITTTTITIIQ